MGKCLSYSSSDTIHTAAVPAYTDQTKTCLASVTLLSYPETINTCLLKAWFQLGLSPTGTGFLKRDLEGKREVMPQTCSGRKLHTQRAARERGQRSNRPRSGAGRSGSGKRGCNMGEVLVFGVKSLLC